MITKYPNIRIATVIATASSITFSHNVKDHNETLLSQFNVGYIRCFITFCFKIETVCESSGILVNVCSIRGRKEEEKKVVSEGMASRIQLHGEDSVVLRVTHSNLKTFNTDIRFSLQLTVEGVKDKLWKKCGTSVNSMHLELYDDARNDKIADLSDNSKPLGFYSPLDGFRLHVVDLDPTSISSGGWLEDTSLVEKYQISEEAYNKRQGIIANRVHQTCIVDVQVFILLNVYYLDIILDTFRKYKEKITSHVPATEEAKISDTSEEELCANIKSLSCKLPCEGPIIPKACAAGEGSEWLQAYLIGSRFLQIMFWVGSRCEVEPGAKRGVVKFVGRAESLGPGFWVGVQYDEPLGKHDGMVKGVRYFECPPSHGGIVRPDKVKVCLETHCNDILNMGIFSNVNGGSLF
ncbi:hypothetical protein V8G54_002824 [Vigna mungo]|uniref:CAP-Gly domain-containing protein n=1 Tax=Vigna mungo TaxID=3915 RepID=A0AAQ3PAY3_VIGMU